MKPIRDKHEILTGLETFEYVLEACLEARQLDGAWFEFIKYAWGTEMEPARAVSLRIYEEPGLKRELRVFVEYDRRGVYIPNSAEGLPYLFERIWRRIHMHVHNALLTEDNSVQTKEER